MPQDHPLVVSDGRMGADDESAMSKELEQTQLLEITTRQFNDDFFMYNYKTVMCNKWHTHDWRTCPFSHKGEHATRRDPRKVTYLSVCCPESKAKQKCPRGDDCPFAHSMYEFWLHPSRYRTQMCHDGVNCKRTICFFAHTREEMRDATYVGDAAAGRGSDSSRKAHHSAPNCLQQQQVAQYMQGRSKGPGAAGGRNSNSNTGTGSNEGHGYPGQQSSSSQNSSSDTRTGDAGGMRAASQPHLAAGGGQAGQQLPRIKVRDARGGAAAAASNGCNSPWSMSESGMGSATPMAGVPSAARVSWPGNVGMGGDADTNTMAAQVLGQQGGFELSPAQQADLALESYMSLGYNPGGFGGILPLGLHYLPHAASMAPGAAGLTMDAPSNFWVGAAEVAAAAAAAGGPMCASSAALAALSGGGASSGVNAGDVQLVPARRLPNGGLVVLDSWAGGVTQPLHMAGGAETMMWLQQQGAGQLMSHLPDNSSNSLPGSPGGSEGMCDVTPSAASAAMASVFTSSSAGLALQQAPGTPMLSPASDMSTRGDVGVPMSMGLSTNGSSMATPGSGAPAATAASNSRLSRMSLPPPAFHPCYYDTPLSVESAAMVSAMAASASLPAACSQLSMGVGALMGDQGQAAQMGLSLSGHASEAPPGLSGISLNMAGLALAVGGSQRLGQGGL